MHRAKTSGEKRFVVWGSGTPKRELFYADDLADACLFLMDSYRQLDVINIGASQDISIKDIALAIRDVVGYNGEIAFDTTKPDGMARKLLDSSRVTAMGWKPRVGVAEGIRQTYRWYLEHIPGR
jgi:GDP-L-fucose synthase